MAALMGIRSIYVFTHDSIGLGEDGPTHQPVEHAASLRLIPNMHVWRPCDAVESAVAWRSAIERSDGPSSLLFSRQGLPHQQRDAQQIADISRGAYVLSDCDGEADLILIASGSEVGLVIQAKQQLSAAGHKVRVVSMPSSSLFDAQDQAYRDAVLPPSVSRRMAVEAGCSALWYKYVGLQGRILGVDSFGESAPASAVFEHFGLTVDNLVKTAAEL
jgi:transketolase